MKRLLSTFLQKWPEFLLEILVIMIGILGAYQLEEWRQERKAKQERSTLLNNLLFEFEENLDKIRTEVKSLDDVVEGTMGLFELTGTDFNSVQRTHLDQLIFSVITYEPSIDLNSGAYLDLLNSDKINLIQNDSLRRRLLSWTGKLDRITYAEEILLQLQIELVLPYLYPRYSLRNLDSKYSPYFRDVSPGTIQHDLSFLNELEFESLLDDQLYRVKYLQEEYANSEVELISVLKLIEEEL